MALILASLECRIGDLRLDTARYISATERRLAALEARYSPEQPRSFLNSAGMLRKVNDDPDGDWDDMWADDDLEEFGGHFNKHRKDFGAKDWNDYARQAQDFYKKGLEEKFPAVETRDGYVKMYDPKTNSFGVYNPEGKATSFYKPTSPTYYKRQVGIELGKGGRMINPLPEE